MAELLTTKDLAKKAGIVPRKLRRLLRSEFRGVGKVKVVGNRVEYRFDPDDPKTQEIIYLAKVSEEQKSKVEKPKSTKVPEATKEKELTQKGGKIGEN